MTTTLLPLDEFRKNLGLNPWHFWQLANDKIPLTDSCNTIVKQYGWQAADAAGRADLVEAIAWAERTLQGELLFSPAPHWNTVTIDVGCFRHGFPKLVTLPEGRVKRIGTRSWVSIGTGAVSFEDLDGDGIKETWNVVISDSTTDPADVGVFFESSDRFEDDDLERWQIRPVSVKRLNATTLQATGKKWLVVKPVLYERWGNFPGYDASMTGQDSSGSYDPDVDANFAARLELFKSTVTGDNTATWTQDNLGVVTTTTLNATACYASAGQVCLRATSDTQFPCTCYGSVLGWPWGPGIYGLYPDGQPCYNAPVSRITISYQAGENLKDWQQAVVRLAIAELDRRICACEPANQTLYRWQRNLAQVSSGKGDQLEGYRISNTDLACPWGQRAGHIYAWRMCQDLKLFKGRAI